MANICPCTFGNSVSQALNNLRKAKKLNQELPEQSGVVIIFIACRVAMWKLERILMPL